jgi:hypothetical protein
VSFSARFAESLLREADFIKRESSRDWVISDRIDDLEFELRRNELLDGDFTMEVPKFIR